MSLVHIPEDIRHEFSIDQKGNVTASRRAVARLCGVEPSSVTRLLDRIKKKAGALQDKETLASIMGRDFHPSDAIVEAVERVLAVGRFKTMHSPKTLPSA